MLFVSYNSEEMKLAYKSNYNKRKNQVILLMINNEANNCCYFAVKNLSELYSLGWLKSQKEAIINGDNDFQYALEDALNQQNIKRHPQGMSKLKSYINKYNQNFQRKQKTGKNLNEMIRKLLLIYYLYHTIQKQ